MAKKKYQSDQRKKIVVMICLMNGQQQIQYKSQEYDVLAEFIDYKDLKNICQQFLQERDLHFDFNIYLVYSQESNLHIPLDISYKVGVQQIFQKMNQALVLIIKGVIDDLKDKFQSEVLELKKQISELKDEVDQLKRPFKQNLDFMRKNSLSPLPMLMHNHSMIEKQLDHIELDIGILFSEPLYDRENKKSTAPAVDFRSQITRLNLALQISFKTNIIMRSEIASFQSLKNLIKYSKPKILHIICHGGQDGHLQFQQDSRTTLGLLQQLKPTDVKDILKGQKQMLPSLVFLNSCHSENVGRAFQQIGVNNVIVINAEDPIADEASQIFSDNFYRNIFKGESVIDSFKTSKSKVEQQFSGSTCCCFHSSTQVHRQTCKWYKQFKKNQYIAHKNYHVPSANCTCFFRNRNRHEVKCAWARKVLFEINQDFRKPPLEEGGEFRFPTMSQMPPYFDKQLIICCCPPQDHKPHEQSVKFRLITKDDGKSILMPIVSNRDRPEIIDLTSTELLEAHEKSKAIFGRQKQLFEFIRQMRETSLMSVFGKSGVGLTTFAIKASTYMTQRRIFQFFFFVDLYDIKDEVVFRYKFNEVTKFQYDGSSISEIGVKNRKILVLFDNCDEFLVKSPQRFYKQLQNILREIKNCKIIITYKEQSKFVDQKRIVVGQKSYELLPFNQRAAVVFLYSKIKDKTDISVGSTELGNLVKKYEVLKIPKVIESLSQSISIREKAVKLEELEKKVMQIKVSDTNVLTQSVLEQLKENSLQAYQFLIFVSLFSEGITFEDLAMFSSYFRRQLAIVLPVRDNWQQHYILLFEKAHPKTEQDQSLKNSLKLPKFHATMSQTQAITIHFETEETKSQFKKNQSSRVNDKQKKDQNEYEYLDNIQGQSYFVDKNGKGRFIVKRFIRDFIWKKYKDPTTHQSKFVFVAYFSVILQILFNTLKQMNYIHQDITTYSEISKSGIFSFDTSLQASYQRRPLTQSVNFALRVIEDLNEIFARNEQLQQKMKKTDPSTFILNHKQDFLKIYDTNWEDVLIHLKSKSKGEQKIFVTMLQNLMIYIPTALKIANSEPQLLRYVLRGSQRLLMDLSKYSRPDRSLILQLKICLIQLGVWIDDEAVRYNIFGEAHNLIEKYTTLASKDLKFKNLKMELQSKIEFIKKIFESERLTCDLIIDDKKIKNSTQKDPILVQIINKKTDFIRDNNGQTIDTLIAAKQGLLICGLILKILLKHPGILFYRNLKQKDLASSVINICERAAKKFKRQKCIKLKLKADLLTIELFWEFKQRLRDFSSSNRPQSRDNKQYEQFDKWRNKLSECEADYLNEANKLRGFTQFDDKIKKLHQQIKQKLWIFASKRIIFMKSYPLSSKDFPIIKNLIRKKNNFKHEIQKILNTSINIESHKQSSSSDRRIGLSPALKSKQSKISDKKHTRNISTKYQILTRMKITEEAKAKCSIMFVTTDFKKISNKIYLICENQELEEDLVEINQEFVSNLSMDNLLILVLSGVNADMGMKRILQLSSNPPIIIALSSRDFDHYQQFDYRHDVDEDDIIEFIRHENQTRRAELAYTKQFILRVTRLKIQSNTQVVSIHEQSERRMLSQIKSSIQEAKVRAFIDISKCRSNISLQYEQGIYRDLSPGYQGNHNIDSKSYESTVFIRRWRKLTEFFTFLHEQKLKRYANQQNRPNNSTMLDPSSSQKLKTNIESSYINIFGEVGCGKTSFIRQIAKIMLEREFYDFGVFLFDGKIIQKNFNGDFELYIKKQAGAGKMPVFEDFERLLSEKTVLIIDDFHLIKPRVNARMKLFIDKILTKKVNLILVSLTELKLDYLPKLRKIKMEPLDKFQTELLANNIIDIDKESDVKMYLEVKQQCKKANRPFTIKDLLERITNKKQKKLSNFPYDMQETSEEFPQPTLKKNHTMMIG